MARRPRHIICVGPVPGRNTMRGLTSYNGRPMLQLEEGARGTIRLDFDAALSLDDELRSLSLGAVGCQACAAFTERQAELYIQGAQPWGFVNQMGFDYGFADGSAAGVRVVAGLSSGEDVALTIYVRAPNRLRDWRARFGSGASVIDQRSRSVYADEPLTDSLPACGITFRDGQIYRVTDFPDLGEDFSQ